MQVPGAGAAAEQVHAAPAQLARARSGQQEPDAALLDQAVNLVQQLGQALHLVDHHQLVAKRQFLPQPPRPLA